MTRVEFIQEKDRPALRQMLEDSGNIRPDLIGLYVGHRPPYETLVAWRGDDLEGMLTGSFTGLDLADRRDFDSFDLPPEPHALLDRIDVLPSARRQQVGQALVEAHAKEASQRGCTFIGGSIDLTSDSRARRSFFESLGFTINDSDCFGARPGDVLLAITGR